MPSPFALFSAFCAFAGYGGWGWFSNRMHELPVALKAGAVQGSYSFVLTLCMALILERIHAQLGGCGARLQFWGSMTICCLLLYSTAWLINYAAGTPEILMTIAPGAAVGTVYVWYYLVRLSRPSK